MVCSLLLSAKAVLFTIFRLLATHHRNNSDAVSLWPKLCLCFVTAVCVSPTQEKECVVTDRARPVNPH